MTAKSGKRANLVKNMDQRDVKALVASLIVLIIATLLALAGSDGGVTVFGGIPLFALCIIVAFVIQWIVFVPSFIKRTEKFYDLTGAFTYSTIIIAAVLLSPDIDLRSMLLMVLILIWAIRLGGYLFLRVLKTGEDKRFEELKQSGPRFFVTWTIQGLWVSFTIAAALAAITIEQRTDFGILGIIGLVIWVIGFAFEAIADYQKSKFRSRPENKDKFITTGLWSISRHPNYFGEILLWIGIAIIALPTLEGLRWFTLISPVFVTLLLTKVSGVPLLEKRADEKWGGQEDYERYKRNTPVLIPRL
jgi:steroid 5-alpha reductase family enzyme